jgi:hypothetical protein
MTFALWLLMRPTGNRAWDKRVFVSGPSSSGPLIASSALDNLTA